MRSRVCEVHLLRGVRLRLRGLKINTYIYAYKCTYICIYIYIRLYVYTCIHTLRLKDLNLPPLSRSRVCEVHLIRGVRLRGLNLLCRGTSLMRNSAPLYDQHRALGIVLM